MIYSINFPSTDLQKEVLAEYESIKDKKKALLTRMSISAAQLTPNERNKIIQELSHYAQTDLICYREAKDAELIARQNKVWNPAIEWAAENLQFKLEITSGIMPIEQKIPHAAKLLEEFDNWRLIPLAQLITACGSFVLGLMVAKQAITPTEATACALLEYSYQQERWGLDDEEIDRQKEISTTMQAAAKFLTLLK